ncbi:MAG: hypothetical protein HQ579_00890 [Candidatus Omnitrophica bacterium]|nr:hypothetical protein [Candidatus Omnitrophota bacterium]
MADKNSPVQSSAAFIKTLIIVVIAIIILWIFGKGILMLISAVKQM